MKKSLSILMSFVIVFCSLGFNAVCTYADPSSETQESEKARIVFGETNTFEKADIKLTGNQTKTAISGKFAIALGTDDASHYMNVDVDESFIYAPDGTTVKISVEYLSKGNGKFSISYYGLNNKSGITDAEVVNISDTGEWRVHEFILDDIKCANGLSGSDFRVATRTNSMGTTAEPVYISSVTVEKAISNNQMELAFQSDHIGNIYGGTDDKKVVMKLKNKSILDVKAQVEYKLIDSINIVHDEGNFAFEVEKGLEQERTIDLNKCIKFDTYKLVLNIHYSAFINSEECELNEEEIFNFSVVNKSNTSERNERLMACVARTYSDESLTLSSEAGFGGIRQGAYWPYYEQDQKGVYDGVGYGAHKNHREDNDKLYAGSAKFNLNCIWLIIGGNSLYEPDKFTDAGAAARPEVVVPTSDEAVEGYAKFAAYIATEYKDTINTIEVWNEYNNKDFNYYSNDGKAYVKLLKATYTAVKAVNPNITIVALTPAFDPSNSLFSDFVKEVLENGGYNYMDAVSLHPYDGYDSGYRLEYLEKRIKQYQDMFKPYGEPKPIIITEIGSSTSTDQWGTTESRQAANYVRICTYALGEKLVDSLAWYNLIDTGDQDITEHRWGLVHSATCGRDAFTAKPSYIAAAAINKMLYDTEIEKRFINTDKKIYGYDFRDNKGNDTAVVWSESGQKTIGLSLGAKEIELYDMNSNYLGTMKSQDGIYSLSTDIDAIYIKGQFEKFEEVAADFTHDSFDITTTSNYVSALGFSDAKKRVLRMEAELPEGIKAMCSYNSTTGRGQLSLQTLKGTEGDYKGRIKFYDANNDLVYTSYVNISIPSVESSHNYKLNEVIAPTCSEMGYSVYGCTYCNDEYKTDYVDKLAHSYKSTVKEPDVVNLGYTLYKCDICGDMYEVNYEEPNGAYEKELLFDDKFDLYSDINDVKKEWRISASANNLRKATLESTSDGSKKIKLNGYDASIYKDLTSTPIDSGKIKVAVDIKPSDKTAFGFVVNGAANLNDAAPIRPIFFFDNGNIYSFATQVKYYGMYLESYKPGNEYHLEAVIDMDKKRMDIDLTPKDTEDITSVSVKNIDISRYENRIDVNSITGFGVVNFGGVIDKTITYLDDFKMEKLVGNVAASISLKKTDGNVIHDLKDAKTGDRLNAEISYVNLTKNDKSAHAIIGYYTENVLKNVFIEPITFKKTNENGIISIEHTMGDLNNVDHVKVMIWNMDTLKPFAYSLELK